MAKGSGNTRSSSEGSLFNRNLSTSFNWSDKESRDKAEIAENLMRKAIREYAQKTGKTTSTSSLLEEYNNGQVSNSAIRVAIGNGEVYYEVQLTTRNSYEYGDSRYNQIRELKDEIWNKRFSSLSSAVKARDEYINKINKL